MLKSEESNIFVRLFWKWISNRKDKIEKNIGRLSASLLLIKILMILYYIKIT